MAVQSPESPSIGSPETQELMSLYSERGDDLMDIDIRAHELVAEKYLKTNRPHEAIKHLLRILPVKKQARRIKFTLATACLESGKYSDAEALFDDLLDEDVSDSLQPKIAARYGLVLFYRDKIQESMKRLHQAADRYPECAEAACYLGQVEASLHTPSPRAESLFVKAIRIDPLYVDARYQQARYFMNLNQFLRSRDSLRAILRIDPLHVKTHSRLGMAYYYLEEPEAAKKSYETALTLNPYDFNTHYNLGELYYTFYNDPNRAAREFKRALEIVPGHAEANFKTGLICLENQQNKEAARYLQKACKKEPSNVRFLLQLAVAYERLGMNDKALSAYQSIVQVDALNHIAQQKIKLLSSG
ncbi:MAG: tetratricopeptide repeat protein [Chitinivibrionales bacterium]|nr:tetratricopeptide repeat protein [Chitinivibrionales bacterium]